MKKVSTIRYLTLGSGGFRGIIFLPYLARLEKLGILNINNIRGFSGSSAGGITAALLAVGWSPEELISHFMSTDITQLVRHSLLNLRDGLGINDASEACKWLETLIVKKTGNGNA